MTIQDIYPLSPMQQGMLYHTVDSPDDAPYFVQFVCRLHGTLDRAVFRSAWQHVIRRHSALRAAFLWEDLDEPLQVVQQDVEIPLVHHNWRDVPADARERRLDEFLEQDRTRGFILDRPPLIRLTLIETAPDQHYFVCSYHHLLLDGWSLSLVLHEVFTGYETILRGNTPDWAPPPPYRNYIAWLQQQDMEAAKSFWQEQLAGYSSSTTLPTDGQTVRQSYRTEELLLSSESTEALQTVVRDYGLTINTLLQGGWGVLLSHYTRETDVVFGTVVAGRPAELDHAQEMVGLFINTLPMRITVSPDAGLLAWLEDLQQQQARARNYDYTPLTHLQKWSDLPHGTPLFESILGFENYPMGIWRRDDTDSITIDDVRFIEQTNYPITIEVVPVPELMLRLFYDAGQFDAGTIRRLLHYYRTVLEGIATDPNQRLGDISLLTEAERRQILVDWNETKRPFPDTSTVHELFEMQVARRTDATAVVYGEDRLSYRTLNRRANQLAQYLRQHGIKRESLVGFSLEQSTDMIVTILGIIKAGGVYVPLDPDYPDERLGFMLEDTGIEVLITHRGLDERLPTSGVQVIRLETDWPDIAAQPAECPHVTSSPDNLLYVMYTSGSTGVPKGIGIPHRAVCRLVCNTDYIELGPDDRIVQVSNSAFDAATFEVWAPLLNGGQLIGIPRETVLSPREFSRALREHRITALFLTTALFNQVARESPAAFADVRCLMFGGQAVEPRWVAKTLANEPPERLVHVYGPTENTTFSTWYQVEEVPAEARTVPIGHPIANDAVYVLDAQLNPVPVGVAGELYVSGPGLARGYLNRPRRTAERFLPNPFSGEPNARMYKTGDLVRYRPDGAIEFIGRVDNQVKIRGYRLEPGEIEVTLGQHEGVQDTVVVPREDTPGEPYLVAYVVPAQIPAPTVSAMRTFLQQRLPEYMVPATFVLIDELPLNPNGKVDSDALPAPAQQRPNLDKEFVAPRTPVEETLAAIWAQALNLNRVGVHDNFFALGGDSIIGIQMISRAAQAGITLSPRQLFEHSTIAELASVAGVTEMTHAEQGLVAGPVPQTPIQRWFYRRERSAIRTSSQAMLLEARKDVDIRALIEALGYLLSHHDVLRLCVTQTGGTWEQIISDHVPEVSLHRKDLAGEPATEQDAIIRSTLADLQDSFDLTEGCLLRMALFDCGEAPGRLLLVCHHLAVDGLSWRILLEDLQTAYHHLVHGEPVQLPPKTTSFKRWAERLNDYARTEAAREELHHWIAPAGANVDLPSDRPEQAGADATGTVTVRLSAEQTRKLLYEVPEAYNTKIDDALLTALYRTLVDWAGVRIVPVHLESHGRASLFDDVDISRTVGWFTALYPIWLEVEAGAGPGEALKAIKEQLRNIPNDGIGYGVLRYLTDDPTVQAQLRDQSQPRIGFNYLGQFDQALPADAPFQPAADIRGPVHRLKRSHDHLIGIESWIAGGRLETVWAYDAGAYEDTTIARLADEFVAQLEVIIAHCLSPDAGGFTPSDFPEAGLDQSEIDDLVAELSEPVE